jgi:protein ImuB
VARYRDGADGAARIIAAGAETAALGPLPLAALRLDPETVTRLGSVGLRTIGAIMAAPRAPLARRFGSRLLVRLDQALGRLGEAVSPRLAVAPLSAERRLAEPVTQAGDVEHLVFMLCATLKGRLEERGEGARMFELTLFRVDGAVHRILAGTSRPVREPALVRRLFAERLAAVADGLDTGCGYELARLSVLAAAPFDARQEELGGDGRAAEGEELARLIDRIGARLGRDTVLRPVAVASHVPERAVRLVPFGAAGEERADPAGSGRGLPPRPLRLFRRPEPIEAMAEIPEGPPVMFRWRRALHRVAVAEGPERLEPEWWLDGDDRARDYYRVEDRSGRRYWLFRQGLYTQADEAPRWFMHGIFA